MNKHNGLAISGSSRELLDRFQFLNVNYSVLQRRGDNELAPGNGGDTSFNERRGNLWNLRSGTMSCYWLVTRSPAHPPFVLMKPDTCFLCLPRLFGTPFVRSDYRPVFDQRENSRLSLTISSVLTEIPLCPVPLPPPSATVWSDPGAWYLMTPVGLSEMKNSINRTMWPQKAYQRSETESYYRKSCEWDRRGRRGGGVTNVFPVIPVYLSAGGIKYRGIRRLVQSKGLMWPRCQLWSRKKVNGITDSPRL